MRVCIAGTGGPVYRSRQLPRFIVTAVSQHLCETVHVLLIGSATASADFYRKVPQQCHPSVCQFFR